MYLLKLHTFGAYQQNRDDSIFGGFKTLKLRKIKVYHQNINAIRRVKRVAIVSMESTS